MVPDLLSHEYVLGGLALIWTRLQANGCRNVQNSTTTFGYVKKITSCIACNLVLRHAKRFQLVQTILNCYALTLVVILRIRNKVIYCNFICVWMFTIKDFTALVWSLFLLRAPYGVLFSSHSRLFFLCMSSRGQRTWEQETLWWSARTAAHAGIKLQ